MVHRQRVSRGDTLRIRRFRAASTRRRSSRRTTRGQTLVEFALVFPLFLTLLLSVIEFAFLFNAILAVQFAAQNAALIAAEIGDVPGVGTNLPIADCAILREVERDIGAPASAAQIQSVDIVWADALTGLSKGSGTTTTTTYTRGGSKNCVYPDGTSATVPYGFAAPNNYPPVARCNFQTPTTSTCPSTAGLSHTGGPDFIAVTIRYTHVFKTPLGTFVPSGSNSLTFSRSNAVRMEPIF